MELGLISHKKYYTYNQEQSIYIVQLENGEISIEANLSELNLSNKNLSDVDIRNIFQVFENSTMRERLKRINLSHNNICSIGTLALSDSFKLGYPVLETIDLSYNRIGDKGLDGIISVLRKHNPNPCPFLRFLDISSNGITAAGAVSIHKLIRRTDGVVSVQFDYNPINGEGLGFIFSSKYWESFNIIQTHADESFDLFTKTFGSKALAIKHLKIMENNLSASSIQLFPSLFSNLPIPSLQTLVIQESLRDSGMNAMIQIGLCRSLMSLKQLRLQYCTVSLPSVFSLLRVIDQGAFPMLRVLDITEQAYTLNAKYEVQVGAHICQALTLDLQTEDVLQTRLDDFYMIGPSFHSFLDRSSLPLATLFNSALRALSLHKLTTITLTHLRESVYSLLHALQFLPATVHHLIIEDLQLYETETAKDIHLIETIAPIETLKLSSVDACDRLVELLQPLLFTLTTVEIQHTPFGDEHVQALYHFMEENHLQLKSLRIENDTLSEESIQLMSLIAPSEKDSKERKEHEKKERCQCTIF